MNFQKRAVAVIDDNDLVREAYDRLLTAGGHSVAIFESAEDFLAVDPNKFDCFLVDYRLPGMDGFTLIEELDARGVGGRKILISGNPDPSLYARLDQIQDASLLLKPCRPAELLETIAGVVA